MAIVNLTAKEIKDMNLNSTPSQSRYPWYTTNVGEGFFIPRTDLSREDYRPQCPPRLRKQGQ